MARNEIRDVDVTEDWEYDEKGRDEVLSSLSGATIVAHSYTYEDYSGYAYTAFVRDGKLYLCEGSHCSCCRLEDQWDPVEVSLNQKLPLSAEELAYAKELLGED